MTTEEATYSVLADIDRDGSFAGDITGGTLRMAWQMGMAAAHDNVAALSVGELTLDNAALDYTPEQPGCLLDIGQGVKITAAYDGEDSTLFTGIIAEITPTFSPSGRRETRLRLEGVERDLWRDPVRVEPQNAVTADTVIDAILVGVGGIDGPLARTLATGKTTFAYVGDTWETGVTAIDAIRQLVEAERGRFFVDRAGHAWFYDRHYLLLDTDSDAALDSNMHGIAYTYGADTVSAVRVTVRPREEQAPGTILWRVNNAQRLAAGVTRRIIARFRDDQGRACGALTVIPPVAMTDYTANTQANGAGVDVTGSLTVTLVSADFSAAVLTVRSSYAGTVYIQPGMQLRGTPIYGGDPVTVEQTDGDAEAAYGKSALAFYLPAMDSIDDADDLARYELGRRKTPRGVVRRMTLQGKPHLAHILARTLFDRVTLAESQTNHSQAYFIVGEKHTVTPVRHTVDWTLELAEVVNVAILGIARLDEAYVLGY